MTNIVGILAHADAHALVLLDELGAGTDPEEGSALARAILTHLIQRGVTTFATTHYSELKVYAHSTPGVHNASVEFDVQTLSPTYELTIGLPGRSNAFAIARRLGLPEGIVEEARQMVSSESLEAESLLGQIKDTQRAALEERRQAELTRQEMARLRQELTEKMGEIEAARREVLEEARGQAREDLEALQRELTQMRLQAASARGASRAQELSALAALSERVDDLEDAYEPLDLSQAPAQTGPWVQPQVGDTVWVDGLKLTGEVTQLMGEEIEVQAGSFRMRVPARLAMVREHVRPSEPEPAETVSRLPQGPTPPLELDLRGLRAEEALLRLEKYLDDAFLSELPWARIVHGKGTGALRHAVREQLATHQLVASFRTGEPSEGGDGVTVVTFAR